MSGRSLLRVVGHPRSDPYQPLRRHAGSGKVEIVVMDGARPLHHGPVCSIQLPHALPYPRALQWVPRYLGPARLAPASWKPARI